MIAGSTHSVLCKFTATQLIRSDLGLMISSLISVLILII